jgi:hypothetical protein
LQREKAEMKRLLVLVLFSAAAQAVDGPADQYLCVADSASGFHFDDSLGKWVPKIFRTDAKWVVRKSKTAGMYEVVKMGDKDVSYFDCEIRDRLAKAFYDCEGIGTFHFNIESGRYMARSPQMYLSNKGLFADDPKFDEWAEIGTCSPF